MALGSWQIVRLNWKLNLISEILLENKIDAIIISNTSESSRDILSNIQRHQKGGLSGKPIETKSNILINKFFKLLNGRIKIIGVGGVDSGKAAYDKFIAGADIIQLYTGMVFKIDIKSKNSLKNIINGGRYDGLISDLGSKKQTPAVGAALNLNY